MKAPHRRPLATVLIVFALFLGVARPVHEAGSGGVQPLTWAGGLVRSIEGFFGHLFAPDPAATAPTQPPPLARPQQGSGHGAPDAAVQPTQDGAQPAPPAITQIIEQFGDGLVFVSPYGDLYPKDGLAPALGTTIHPYSQLNLTKASIDSSGNLSLAGGLTVAGVAGGIAHIDGVGKLWTGKLDTGDIGSGTLGIGNGGTGATTLTQYGVLYGNGTSGIGAVAPGTSGYVLQSTGSGAAPSWVAASGLSVGSVAFSGITSGTNTAASMLVGSGASLNFTGTGTINASSLLGNTWAAPGAIGSTTPNTGNFTNLGLNNGGVINWKDTVGSSIQILSFGGDNVVRIGALTAPATNGNTFIYGGGNLALNIAPTGNMSSTHNLTVNKLALGGAGINHILEINNPNQDLSAIDVTQSIISGHGTGVPGIVYTTNFLSTDGVGSGGILGVGY